MKKATLLSVAVLCMFGAALQTGLAAPVIFLDGDAGAGPVDARPNSNAAAAAFDGAAGSLGGIDIIDFENLPVGTFTTQEVAPGVTVTLSGTDDASTKNGISTNQDTTLGYNTTAGGTNHLGICPIWDIGTTSATFDFDVPIQAFGMYLTGLGTANGNLHILFDDGSTQDIPVGGYLEGGVQFFGFTSAGSYILSVAIELQDVLVSRDIFGIDDVRLVAASDPTVIVPVDIKPQSCPNPLNVKSKGVLPAAVLGSDVLDVNDIDVASLEILGVRPIRSNVEDVAAPVAEESLPEDCLCNTDGPDGYIDLTLKFDTQEIIAAIGEVEDGDSIILTLTGFLKDGTPIEGTDCVLMLKKGKP